MRRYATKPLLAMTALLGLLMSNSGIAARTPEAIAIETLQRQTGIANTAINVRSVAPVKWNASEPSCRLATETSSEQEAAHRVVLQAVGRTYVVYVANEHGVVCEREFKRASSISSQTATPPTEAGGSLDDASRALVATARADLARRLGSAADKIELVSFEAVIWPDSSFGCPHPGMIYTQVRREGFRIRLRVDDAQYVYHGGENRPPFLCDKK